MATVWRQYVAAWQQQAAAMQQRCCGVARVLCAASPHEGNFPAARQQLMVQVTNQRAIGTGIALDTLHWTNCAA